MENKNPLTEPFLRQIEVSKTFDNMVLPEEIIKKTEFFVEEQSKAGLLRAHNLEPSNKILLTGNPGTGKTLFAEALAERLRMPLYVVKYEMLGGSLAETADKLDQLFHSVRDQYGILLFENFDGIGECSLELGDVKRAVRALLFRKNDIPSYNIVIGTTRRLDMLDSDASRWFQLRLDLPMPNQDNIRQWLEMFKKKYIFDFKTDLTTLAERLCLKNYADIEDFSTNVLRRHILSTVEKGANYDFTIEEIVEQELEKVGALMLAK